MSLAIIIAFIVALVIFLGAIFTATDNYLAFISFSSFLIVVGGTMAASFVSYEARYVGLSLKLCYRVFGGATIKRDILKSEVGRVIRWAYTVQKNGLPALEAESRKAVRGDRFLKFGIDMVVSGYNGDEVREILHNTIETTYGRNTVQVNILKDMSSISPAFGMIGTLVGLIIMLGKMGEDPTQLGPGLAVALLTTLYGVLFARMLLSPVSSKVMQREQIMRFRNYLVAEGLALLADRKSPRYIQDKMNSYLDPALHFNIDKMKR
ncbi:MAG: MotA/TolQ/ExbB proton channel family protein [Rhodospirillales bacterium]|nr:MotA/TolQ/ExbB proton channel family protein [Rhodospirillales bacterium]